MVALFSFAKTFSASDFATSNCVFNSSYFLSYAAILSGVFPVSSAFVNRAASAFNLAFSSAVAASTKACFAASNATFFSLTLFKASVTCSWVAFSSLITVSAALIASVAAVFASLYVFALSAVFPVVGSASVAKVLKASFAFVNSVLSALSFNISAAFANSAFIASTFACAAWASDFVALSPFASTAAAAAFASSNCGFNFSYAASYAVILAGVLPVSSAFTNESASAFNLAFSSAVAASTKACFAASNADFFSLTLFKASVTCSVVAFSSLITVSASWIASFAAVFASLYAFVLSVVFPVVGSASVVKVLNASFACVNSVLSALFTNNSAAFVNSAFAASTFVWAACTSALDALFSFANTAEASVLAVSNCAFIASYFVL